MFERALEPRRIDGPEKKIGVSRWCIGRALRALGRTEEALVIQEELITTLPEDGYVSER